jgi:hypothetical protein
LGGDPVVAAVVESRLSPTLLSPYRCLSFISTHSGQRRAEGEADDLSIADIHVPSQVDQESSPHQWDLVHSANEISVLLTSGPSSSWPLIGGWRSYRGHWILATS